MSFWTAVVVIVAISAIAGVLRDRYKAIGRAEKARQAEPEERISAAEKREVEELRERIKVLERIATDGNSLDASETKRIAAEIEALRDQRADVGFAGQEPQQFACRGLPVNALGGDQRHRAIG